MTLTEAVQELNNREDAAIRRDYWEDMSVSVQADGIDGEDIFIWNQVEMKCAMTPEDIQADDWEVIDRKIPARRLKAV